MINILHIINEWPIGGIQEQVYLISKYLDKAKFTHYIIGNSSLNDPFVVKFESIGVKCILSDKYYTNLYKIIKKYSIDIVHKQTGGKDYPVYVNQLHTWNIPLIETIHCPRQSSLPLNKVSKIICTTPFTVNKHTKEQQTKIEAIQYSLDIHKPFVEVATVKKDRAEPLVVGKLSRVIPGKGIGVILSLAEKTYKEYGKKIQFSIAGVLEYHTPILSAFNKEFLNKVANLPNVTYHGFIKNKFDFWKTLDICINPTEDTSFDIIFLEAMSYGTPILAWRDTASPYVVENTGIITDRNIDSLYEGLKLLYNDRKLREKLGNNGINKLKTTYSLSTFIKKYSELYKKTLISFKKVKPIDKKVKI